MEKGQVKDFISDEEMEKIDTPDFISDEEMLAMDSTIKPLSPLETFGASLADEVTLGYGPNILAGAKTGSFSSPAYIEARDKLNELLTISETENPKSSIAGSAAGIVGSMAMPLGAPAKGANLLGKIGKGALVGAGAGAALDTPDQPGEITTTGRELEQRAAGAAVGGIVGGALTIAGALIPESVPRGFSAMGPSKKDVTKVLKAEKTGGKMTREKLVNFAKRKGIMKFGDDVEEMYTKTLAAKDATGEQLGEIYKNAQRLDLNKLHGGMDVAKEQLFARNNYNDIKNRVMSKIKKDLELEKDQNAILGEISSYFDIIAKNRADAGSIPDIIDLHTIKKKLGSYAKYSKNAAKSGSQTPEMEKAWAKAERLVSDEIDNAITTVAGGDKKLAKQLKELNEDYSYLMRIEDMIESRVAGDLSVSRFFGIPEMINESLQPRINTGLSTIGAGIEAVGRRVPSPLAQPQNLPLAAPMIMQQRTTAPMQQSESPLQRYKSGQ